MPADRVVLVTGGNRGIGRSIAERFVAAGYKVAVTARSGEGPEGTLTVRSYAKQLTGMGRSIGDRRSESFRVGETLVVAEIDDTGHGVPEDQMQKIFEPFFTTKPAGSGTGLGLSTVMDIVKLHGGALDDGKTALIRKTTHDLVAFGQLLKIRSLLADGPEFAVVQAAPANNSLAVCAF
jgi:NAD(P)-dependent dehydrogenase (short-subunit alcohol dehydrogenase family)